jgi:hypothetical protein
VRLAAERQLPSGPIAANAPCRGGAPPTCRCPTPSPANGCSPNIT